MPIGGPGIPLGSFVSSLSDDGTSLTFTNPVTASGTATITNTGVNLTRGPILSFGGSISVTSSNAASVATIAGGTAAIDISAGSLWFDIAPVTINGNTNVASVTPTLNVLTQIYDSVNLSTGSPTGTAINKTGNGLLQLSNAQSFFDGGVNVMAGGLVVGGSSFSNGTQIQSGPLGTGMLTMSNNTTLLSSGVNTVANAYSLNGTLNFSGTSNLTLTGAATLPAGITTLNVDNPWITLALGGVINAADDTAILNKTGLGRLSIIADTGFIGGITLNGGTLALSGKTGVVPQPMLGSSVTVSNGLLQLLNDGLSSFGVISYPMGVIASPSVAGINLQVGGAGGSYTGNIMDVPSVSMTSGQVLNVSATNGYNLRIDTLNTTGSDPVRINPGTGITVAVYDYTGGDGIKPINVGAGRLLLPDVVYIGTLNVLGNNSAAVNGTVTLTGATNPLILTQPRVYSGTDGF
ncbi:hypothetical protein EBZ35_08165, partial [bacterium]|nr:hypothetical protein [bacterium]